METAVKNNSIAVGTVAKMVRVVTDDDVKAFAEVTGDMNPLHLDEDYAKNTIFGRRIVHGAFSVGLISALIADKLPGKGSILLSQYVKYLKPVAVGDELVVTVEIIATETKNIQTNRMLLVSSRYRLRTFVTDQRGNLVIDGEAEVLR